MATVWQKGTGVFGIPSLVIVSLLAGPTMAEANYTIGITGSGHDVGVVRRIGSWSVRTATIERGTQVFGSPSSVHTVRPGFNPPGADCGSRGAHSV